MSSKIRQAKLLKMWKENPHCRNCGILTTLPPKKGGWHPDNCATIDHLYSRHDPRRYERPETDEKRYRLWCHKCNRERGRNEHLAIPIEERRLASGRQKKI